MTDRAHVLVVEDEVATRQLVASYFEAEGYRVTQVGDGTDVVERVLSENIDIVLLDIRLPLEDGMDLTRQLRAASDVGIILVTAKTDEVDRIVGLELGADDYVTKPFNSRELFARTKNLIRRVRVGRTPTQRANKELLEFNGWQLDTLQHQLRKPGSVDVRLTEGEYQLLVTLAKNPRRILSREQLLDAVSHKDWAPIDRTIDVMVGKIRRKLDDDPLDPVLVKTVRGAGYMFAVDVNEVKE